MELDLKQLIGKTLWQAQYNVILYGYQIIVLEEGEVIDKQKYNAVYVNATGKGKNDVITKIIGDNWLNFG